MKNLWSLRWLGLGFAFCVVAGLAPNGMGSAQAQAVAPEKPNVLFIIVDDLNDVPTFMGRYPDAKTPNMDRLAKRGVTFLDAHCAVPVCNPSRACFMSGLNKTSFDASQGTGVAAKVEKKIQEVGGTMMDRYFKNAGYEVISVGKVYHNGTNTSAPDVIGGRASFGKEEAINFPSDETLTDWGVPSYGNRDSRFSDFKNAKFAVEQIERDHDKPFLLMLGFVQPHVPWYTPQSYVDLYPPEVELAPYDPDDLDDISAESIALNIKKGYPRTNDMIAQHQRQNIMRHYLACVSFTDHYIGQVLDALDASPYADNTMIVLLSDHGYLMGEKNTYQKHALWERATHVPVVFAGPGIPSDARSERPVGLIDLYPTILEFCGLPENPVMQGQSLTPLLEDPDAAWDRPVVMNWRGNNYAVHTDRYRYLSLSHGSEELYDHQTDPGEITNLAADPAYADIKQTLKLQLPLNFTSSEFALFTYGDQEDPEPYLKDLLARGDLMMFGQSITDLDTVVNGMSLETSIDGNYFKVQMVPAK